MKPARTARKRSRRACAVPPHADHKTLVIRTPGPATGAVRAGRAVAWMLAAPADRASLPAAVMLYGTGAALGAAHADPLAMLALGAGSAGVTYGTVQHTGKDAARAIRAGAAAGIAGAWLSAAAEWGAIGGPGHFMTWAWLAGAGIGYRMLRSDEQVAARRELRNAKAAWHATAAKVGLNGSHLLSQEETRLGDAMVIDVTGTGRRASGLAGGDLAERLAELYRLPPTRVRVTADRIAGRIRISIRRRDPWADPILHPQLDDAPEIELPKVATIRMPQLVGADPETGHPIAVELWDEDGAKRLLIVAVTRGGKTVLMNDLTERLTAADDVLVWTINLSKAKEDRRWAPAVDLAAIGPRDRLRALAMLRLAHKVIDWRGASDSDDAVHQPTPYAPVLVLKIDELSALAGAQDQIGQAIRDELAYIQSKGGSEGVAVVAAAQRGVVTHTGNGDIRTQFDKVALLKTRSRAEMIHAAGDLGMEVPDMTKYGEGHAGVVVLADLGGDVQIGRSFFLKELTDIDRIAAARTPEARRAAGRPVPELEPELVDHLGEAYAKLKAEAPGARAALTPAPAEPAQARTEPPPTPSTNPLRMLAQAVKDGHIVVDDPATRETLLGALAIEERRESASLDALDAELESALPADLRRIGERNDATRAMLAQTAAIVMPEVPADKAELAARAAAERRDQAAAAVNIPAAARERLTALVGAPGGTSRGDVATALGVSRMTAWRYLERLRVDGLAESYGQGRGARWRTPGGGDAK